MILCSAANSKLDTISSAHVQVSVIRHLSKNMRYILSRMSICLHVLSLSMTFPRSVPHARVGIGDALKNLS